MSHALTGPVVRLSAGRRAVRTTVTLVVAALLTAGTLWGGDDVFPFGPFRMFATSSATTGAISVAAIEVRTAPGDWQPAPLTLRTVGMNRAEVEGQMLRMEAEPELLGSLAGAYARLHPGAEPWVGVRLKRRSTVILDGVPTGEVREAVLAEWTRP